MNKRYFNCGIYRISALNRSLDSLNLYQSKVYNMENSETRNRQFLEAFREASDNASFKTVQNYSYDPLN